MTDLKDDNELAKRLGRIAIWQDRAQHLTEYRENAEHAAILRTVERVRAELCATGDTRVRVVLDEIEREVKAS